jgi:glycosyltransferase involved in cell wall biosynthesis
MKVALVHDFLNVPSGGAERVLQVLKELYPSAPVYTLLYDEVATKGQYKGWDIRTSTLQRSILRKRHKYLLPWIPKAVESFDLSEYDLVISSSNSFVKGVITRPETLHICYYHTPTAYLWFWYFNYLEEQRLGLATSAVVRGVLHFQRIWDRVAADRVDRFIANSRNVKLRIKKYYRRDSKVIYPPVDVDRFTQGTGRGEYFFYVGRLSRYKRARLVVEAFNKSGLPLVVVGTGEEEGELRKIAKPNVTILGWQSDSEVSAHMSRCRALIFPTEDDFGIVPVEAMASGRPVIAFGRGGALETVIPGKTGELFSEPSAESLNSAVNRFLKAENRYSPATLRKFSEKFSTARFKNEIRSYVDREYKKWQQKR